LFLCAYGHGCYLANGEELSRAGSCSAADFRIAIDVGHTRESSGAKSARGVSEFTYNLALANQLKNQLRIDGFRKILLIVSHLVGSEGLKARSASAAAFEADVFVSIHHDSVQRHFLKSWTPYNSEILLYSDKYQGYSLFVSYLGDHGQRSLELARNVGLHLKKAGLKFSTHHGEKIPGEGRDIIDAEAGIYRFDQLQVLRNAQSPSILIEAGVIVNREEEMELRGGARQDSTVKAISLGVLAYCNAHPRPPFQPIEPFNEQ